MNPVGRNLLRLLPALLAATCLAADAPGVVKSDSGDREAISLTVYNSNRALVHEVRHIQLPGGLTELWFQDVAARILPQTVAIKGLSGTSFRVLEQNYEFDLLSPQKLLEKYVGEEVVLVRWRTEKDSTVEERVTARLLSINSGTVWKVGGQIIVNPPYAYLEFPELPGNLYARPTLVWLLETRPGAARLETSYLTGNITWQADYVFTLADDDRSGDLIGWVTINNQSGARYENAALKLIAGDVRTVAPDLVMDRARIMVEARAETPQFAEKAFFEYHLYTLERPSTLNDRQQKQIELLRAADFRVEKEFIIRGQPWYYARRHGETDRQKVAVTIRFENSEQNNLGMPLPKGTVRVYKKDTDGSAQFIGEDTIDHTPKDETLRLRLGNAFDIVAERRQTDYRIVKQCVSETAFEIEIRNHKEERVVVQVIEPVGGDWKMLSHSHPFEKRDAFTVEFSVGIGPDSESILAYRVRSKYCD
ncbi:MAG: DUF4139 domain-containing protein [Acidobacteriota bacterium]